MLMLILNAATRFLVIVGTWWHSKVDRLFMWKLIIKRETVKVIYQSTFIYIFENPFIIHSFILFSIKPKPKII